MSIYGDYIFSINEGLFDNKSRPGKPRKKAIAEAKKFYRFIINFINNETYNDLGYNEAETFPTILAGKYANIPEKKINDVFKYDRNDYVKKHKTTLKKYFGFTKNELKEHGTSQYDEFIKANFNIDEIIYPILEADAYDLGMIYRYKDNKFYQFPREYTKNTVKPINFYSILNEEKIKHLNDSFFNKEEFDIAIKEMEN